MEWQVPKMWSGDCYIIGGGSSLANQFNASHLVPEERDEFLEFGMCLSSLHGEHIIGVNLAAFLGDWVDIAYWGDTDTYNQYRGWFDDFAGLKVSSAGKFADPKFRSIKHLYKKGDKGISEDPSELSWIGKNSGASAINLAYHLGCTRILLLGFDMKSSPGGRIHWHTGYPDKLTVPSNADIEKGNLWVPRDPNPKENYNRHLQGFKEVALDAERLGIEIINLCPDSEIKEFPKMSYQEFVRQESKGITEVKKKEVPNKVGTCFCKGDLVQKEKIHSIPVSQCNVCGAIKQIVQVDIDGYYKNKYHQEEYTHSYDEDVVTAHKRLDKYQKIGLNATDIWLDVGSGNGAFKDASISKGIPCYGLDVTDAVKSDYNKPLEQTYFPTDHFGCVFLHDVLEHLEDPLSCLKECFRIVSQKGTVVIEYPDFFGLEGERHWKMIEHLWMLTSTQLVSLAEEIGFEWNHQYTPVVGKLVLIFRKPKQKRIKILVPPGIGDIHWVLVKLQSFLRSKEITDIPDVYIASMDSKKDRSIEYLELFPFINAAGYLKVARKEIPWREAYNEPKGRTVFENVAGCDYFISFNGALRSPRTLDQISPQYPCNYDLPMFESKEERLYGQMSKEICDDYVVIYIVESQMYRQNWLEILTIETIHEITSKLVEDLGCSIVLVGSEWDKDGKTNRYLLDNLPGGNVVDLVGQTDIPQLFGLIKNSIGVIGFPSGLTIMSTYFKVPIYIFWSDYFNTVFWEAACYPDPAGEFYKYGDVRTVTAQEVVDDFKSILPDTASLEELAIPEAVKQNHVVCVLRSGGDYTGEYVTKLKAMVSKNLTVPFKFWCLTDLDDLGLPEDEIIKLKHDWPGWWAKLEIFRPGLFSNSKVVYFDLDTVITGNLDKMFEDDEDFRMLQGFSPSKPDASGVMLFQTDLSPIYDELISNEHAMYTKAGNLKWDQRFISKAYREIFGISPFPVQGVIDVASYKKHIKKGVKKASDCPIICFHGKPRPHECYDAKIVPYWGI